MSEVNYSLNGYVFRDFGVYVSESINIVGMLEKKPLNQYDWAEYNGISVDLQNIRFKEREIELKCFIRSENWENLFENFRDIVIAQFSKKSTQRLVIDPMGYKKLAYEVYMKDDVKLEKTFREGIMYAEFSLKMIEPNPIKKILKTSLDTLRLKYTAQSETEIFPGDGTKLIGRGDVDFQFDYSKPNFEGSGISLVQGSALNSSYFEVYTVPTQSNSYQFSVEITLTAPANFKFYVIGRKPDNTYELIENSTVIEGSTGINKVKVVADLNMSSYTKFFYKVLNSSGNEIPGIIYSNPKIETAEVIGNWQDMTGKEKIIIIAGNIDDLTILETPAEVIWEKI